MTKDIIILDPWPRTAVQIFDAEQLARLKALGELVFCDSRTRPNEFESALPEASVILGQPDLSHDHLARATKLRCLVNVEGNFFDNVDYQKCFISGIHVLSIAPAFAVPVAEMAVGLALNLARSISQADAEMRMGTETYGSKGGIGALSLSRASVGIIGYGYIGRALRKLLRGFSCKVFSYDPWLPKNTLREEDTEPVSLDDLLSQSQFIFVCAAATKNNRHLIGRPEMEKIRPDAALILLSRADLVDFEPLLDMVNAGDFRAAIDVFPQEPVPADHPIRRSKMLLSPHRAGGTRAALSTAAEMIIDDIGLILRGLPPIRLQPARCETVGLARSKPANYGQNHSAVGGMKGA